MKHDRLFNWVIALSAFFWLGPTACAPVPAVDSPVPSMTAATIAATLSPEPSPQATEAPATPTVEDTLIVAFVENGDIKLWREATNQTETIFDDGGVSRVVLSDDAQLIAFTRHWFDFDQCEQSALWIVNRNGENAREIVSPAELGATLGDMDCEYPSAVFAQIEWLPRTHRLVYSVISDGEHASPQGLYLADADTLSIAELIPADYSLRFVSSPDGSQIALISATSLGFINADGWRQDVLAYPKKGVPIARIPNGVWTQDGRAFLIAAPIESESMFALNYTIMRVPLYGSAAQQLATITNTNLDSVAFSPDGQQAAFAQDSGWFITPLPVEVGPVAIPRRIILDSYANLHWSPEGAAYLFPDKSNGALFQLCPNATQGSQVCGEPLTQENGFIDVIQWIDGDRFLYLTREPHRLSLGRLDGTTIPIVTWSSEDGIPPERFSAVLPAPH